MTNHLIRYFDMFAGIGGFQAGLTRMGGFQCVSHCRINKYANAIDHCIWAADMQLRKEVSSA